MRSRGTAAMSRPLAELLADPAIEIVVHAGRQDMAILRRVWRYDPANVFDTQIAAGFAGAGAQMGYGNLLGSILGLRVGKSASFTRWDARPLTDEQLSYAAEDVAHLLELSDELQRRLIESGRLEWAREECRRIENATDERDPETAWERLPRIGQLDPRSRAVAKALAAWRERTAATEDRPVGSVLADPTLVELAKRHPSETQGPRAHPRPAPVADQEARRGRAGGDRRGARSAADTARAGARALGAGRRAADFAGRGAAARASAGRPDSRTSCSPRAPSSSRSCPRRGAESPSPTSARLSGWRRELVGDDLRDLLAGRRAARRRRRPEARSVAVALRSRSRASPTSPPSGRTARATGRPRSRASA